MSCGTLLFISCPNRSFLPAFVPLIGCIARYAPSSTNKIRRKTLDYDKK